VQRLAARLKEAQRLGFTRAVVPQASLTDLNGNGEGAPGVGTPGRVATREATLEVVGVPSLRDALSRSGIADS
jgi:hypothetical protein